MLTNYGSGSAPSFDHINVYACVLAGGQSRRMGRDKSALVHKDKSLLEYCLQSLSYFSFKQVLVSKGAGVLNTEGIIDQYPNAGPVGGIYSVCNSLGLVRGEYILFLPVDMPSVKPLLIDYLLTQAITHKRSCFYANAFFPIVLRFDETQHKKLLTHLSQQKTLSVKGLLESYEAKELSIPSNEQLNNINTPQDWRKFISQ
ncbi:molybdenum cofactor guanylyltransferase [Glaciecola petra]|uniref:Molybdenum cofactor guanylyltransferase n=1 Tax=Glaciecola petra TaxID=3075602 RepID=A0ABU2ZSS9_9ALTE|nr:molybdenum cofactor guanylyltransferase [Aestuariibacter sp. P117]MDT0595695.1 molybdenum cofactor guanylyltransferase [Aestuariibacter sp. P117]